MASPSTPAAIFPAATSLSVLLQVFFLPLLGTIADYTNLKKRMMMTFAYIGAITTTLLFPVQADMPVIGTNGAVGLYGRPVMITDIGFRSPKDLQASELKISRVLVIGSCLVGNLPEVIPKLWPGAEADWIAQNHAGTLPAQPPNDIGTYDFQIVQIATPPVLRARQCIALTQTEAAAWEALFHEACERLELLLHEAMQYNRTHGLLSFVSNFLVPQQNPLGRLLPRGDYRDLTYFFRALNRQLDALVQKYTDAYVLDVEEIAASLGKRYLVDDARMITTHNAIYTCAYDDLDLARIDVISVVLFLTLSFTAGRWLVRRALAFVQDEITSPNRLLTLVVVLTFAWGAISQAIGLEAIFGAFIMGILFGQMPRLPQAVIHTLEAMALGIFAPIFFAVAGLKVNLTSLLQPRLLLIALLVIAVATFGKVIGTYVGARWIGRRDHYTALAFGAGLDARGAMEIIIATIGLNLGILSQDMFSIIVLMAMVTSLMAPAALRWLLQRIPPDEMELKRLRQEELAEGSLQSGACLPQ